MSKRRRPKLKPTNILRTVLAVIIYLAVFGTLGIIIWQFFFPQSFNIEFEPKSKSSERGSKLCVGIIDQFYSVSPDFTDNVVNLLRKKGISVSIHKDEEVTVELYRNLPSYRYKLIILRVHAAVDTNSSGEPVFLFTSEPYSTDKYFYEQITDQIACGTIANMSGQQFFIVGPKFIEKSVEGSFNGSIVVLSSCTGLHSLSLAEAFIKRGVAVFVSWDKTVSLHRTDEAVLALIEFLIINKLPLSEAVDRVMLTVGRDPEYNSTLKYYPASMGFIIFTEDE